jgi:hypothetical protein
MMDVHICFMKKGVRCGKRLRDENGGGESLDTQGRGILFSLFFQHFSKKKNFLKFFFFLKVPLEWCKEVGKK